MLHNQELHLSKSGPCCGAAGIIALFAWHATVNDMREIDLSPFADVYLPDLDEAYPEAATIRLRGQMEDESDERYIQEIEAAVGSFRDFALRLPRYNTFRFPGFVKSLTREDNQAVELEILVSGEVDFGLAEATH